MPSSGVSISLERHSDSSILNSLPGRVEVAKAMGVEHGITTHIDYQPNGDVEQNLG